MNSIQKIPQENNVSNGTQKKDASSKKRSIFAIDKEMWRFKLHYFLFIGGIAMAYPFVPDFAKSRIGISTSALAVLLMTQQFLYIFTKPLIGYLADYFNKLKALLCGLTAMQGLCLILLLFIPKIEQDIDIGFERDPDTKHCFPASMETNNINFQHNNVSNNNIFLNFMNEGNNMTDFLIHVEEQINECNVLWNYSTASELIQNIEHCKLGNDVSNRYCKICHPNTTDEIAYTCYFPTKVCMCALNNISWQNWNCDCLGISNNISTSTTSIITSYTKELRTYQFWIFVILYTIAMVCGNAIFTLSDTACCESVEKAKSDFGRQRLWGAIGWGLVAPVAGIINDYMGDYITSWIVMQFFMVLVVWNLLKLELTKPQFSKNILKDVNTVLKSRDFILFELGLFMNGIGAAMVWYYLILFLLSIGASKLLCGLSLTVQSFLGSIPMMFYSGKIITKIGHQRVQSFALLMYFVRFITYSYLYDPWCVLFVEYLHGITYGLLYANIASFGKASSKPGTEATTQSVLFTTHEGLGGGIGCVLGGLGLDLLGGRQTFFIASLFMICGSLLHLLSDLLFNRKKGTLKVTSET